MRRFTLGLVFAVAALSAAPARAEDVTLSGCLINGGEDGYLLTNTFGDQAWRRPGTPDVEPGPVGTAGNTTIFYWLKADDELKPHAGHRIEVRGEIEGDVEPGKIKIDRKDSWTEVEVEADGNELKARVPNALLVSPRDRQSDVLVRKVDTKSVRMLAATCQP